jgi:hypothetical protein
MFLSKRPDGKKNTTGIFLFEICSSRNKWENSIKEVNVAAKEKQHKLLLYHLIISKGSSNILVSTPS